MRTIRIGSAAINTTPLDWEGNRQKIIASLNVAREKEIKILCLPEMSITGYGCDDLFLAPWVSERALKVLHQIVPHTQDMVASVGLPLRLHNQTFNAAALLCDGKILGFRCKRFLCNDGIHYESRWFTPWPKGHVAQLKGRYPCGDLLFCVDGLLIGYEICEDAWVRDRPAKDFARRGVDVILNPSASHFAFGKYEVRRKIIQEGSRIAKCTYIQSNLLGCEAGRVIYEGGTLIAHHGKILNEGPRFLFSEVIVSDAVAQFPRAQTRQGKGVVTRTPGVFPHKGGEPPTKYQKPKLPLGKHIEFPLAVTLGLHDYLRKSKGSGFVVSLSGGADSAAVCVLVYLMIKRAVAELGFQQFCDRFSYSSKIRAIGEEGSLYSSLLTTAYQETAQSSETTKAAAGEVARACKARFFSWSVEEIVGKYTKLAENAIGRPLSWSSDDLALQNVQARVRAPSIWLLANVENALLLVTSNRSEAAVGYCTMDGDTSGGLCPIAGIDKSSLREWLRFMERDGGPFGAVPELKRVNDQAPTAELRPREHRQTDEGDLMPYEVLNKFELHFVRDRMSPSDTLGAVTKAFQGTYTKQELLSWSIKFFQLFARSQWKRERFAPGFHLDDENLDPRSWYRFPILSSGFGAEIEQMRGAR